MDSILQNLSEIIASNIWLGFLLAFVAGGLTFFTPCSLSSIPLIIAYVGGASTTRKKALLYSIFLALGQTIVFVVLGVLAALIGIGMTIGGFGQVWYTILAFLMLFMAFETIGLTNFLSRIQRGAPQVSKKGVVGALFIGMLGALFSTPCATPVLTAMLAYVTAIEAGVLVGGLLLLFYSLGYSVFIIIAGLSVQTIRNIAMSNKFQKVSLAFKIILAVLMFVLAIYFIYQAFFINLF